MVNRFLIVLVAVIFNLSFEYSLRGFNGFFRSSLLPFILFGFYFTLYTMVEDLIARFKIKNYQLVLIVFLYGIFPMAFGTGALFNRPRFLGIDWVSLFYIGFLWWGILQAIFTFYLANRLIKRNWDHPRMGKLGWSLCIFYNIVALAWVKANNPYLAKVQPVAYAIFFFIAVSTITFLWLDIKRNVQRKPWQFRPSRLMDFLSFGSFVLFIILGAIFGNEHVVDPISASHINPTATKIVHLWTICYTLVFLIYRLTTRKEITI